MGDAHLENFGTIWGQTRQGKVLVDFTMNDPDDGGPAPLYADLLRFLTGCLIYRPNQPALPIINAYRRGLEGDRQLSYLVQERIAKARKKGPASDWPDELTRKYKLKPKKNKRFEIKKKIPKKLEKQLRREIKKLLGSEYKVSRLWAAKKLSGGSGGIQRFRGLLKRKKRASRLLERNKPGAHNFLLLEFKAQGKPGIFPLVCPMPPLMRPITASACSGKPTFVRNRLYETLRMERDGKVSRHCSVVKVKPIGPMLTRALWQGKNSVQLKEISSPIELSQWIEDAAKTLGRLHRQSLPVESSYPQDIQACSPQLTKAAQQLALLFKRASKILH